MKYLPKNVFLDTNVYEENNFFYTTLIQNLFYYSKIEVIKLHITRISYWELIDRMKKGLVAVKDEHNRYVNSINSSRILKNLQKFESVKKSKFKIDQSIEELTKKLDTIIRSSNIKIIEPQEVDINNIFHLYYTSSPPFNKKSDKKHEFPDAFIIKTIENWCVKNKTKMIFITKDNDFKDYKNPKIIFKKDLTVLLEDISKYYDSLQSTQLIPEIDKRIKTNNEELLTLIDGELDTFVTLDIDFEKTTNKRTYPKFVEYKITSIRPGFADICYYIEVEYSFVVFQTEHDINKSFFSDSLKPKLISEKILIPCDLEVHFEKKNDIRLKRINSNEAIKLKLEY